MLCAGECAYCDEPAAPQKFGVYASSVKNTIPTSRGFDFYTYANQDPSIVPGSEPDADKFNARALRSFEALMNRAERLGKLVRTAPSSGSPVKRVA